MILPIFFVLDNIVEPHAQRVFYEGKQWLRLLVIATNEPDETTYTFDIILHIIGGEVLINLRHKRLIPEPQVYLVEEFAESQGIIDIHQLEPRLCVILHKVTQVLVFVKFKQTESSEGAEQL